MDFEKDDLIINTSSLKANMFDELYDIALTDGITDQDIIDKLMVDIEVLDTIKEYGCQLS